MTLEELGWTLITELSTETYLVYNREDGCMAIDLDKKQINFLEKCDDVSFATLEAIRNIVIDNAIY